MSYLFAVAILMLLMFTLTHNLLMSLGYCVSFIGWWGWIFWIFDVFPSVDIALYILLSTIVPISISLVIGFLLSKCIDLGLRSRIYISVSAYYITGTLYFMMLKILLGRAPDIDFIIVLPIWLTILVISTLISNRFIESISK
uniref:Uncharacterized protein n=1 Tax=Ignisphaera aggregans TaxID=334771 RepID=A0A832AU58_9CREN